jgi:hypothetical protein
LTKVSVRIQGKNYYYLSGEKLFKVKPADECMINLSSKGLVVVDRGGAVSSDKISSWAYSEYCGDAPESTMPLGTVSIGTRMLWVMRVNLEDGFDYTLFDPLLGDGVELKGGLGDPNEVRTPMGPFRQPLRPPGSNLPVATKASAEFLSVTFQAG